MQYLRHTVGIALFFVALLLAKLFRPRTDRYGTRPGHGRPYGRKPAEIQGLRLWPQFFVNYYSDFTPGGYYGQRGAGFQGHQEHSVEETLMQKLDLLGRLFWCVAGGNSGIM